MEDFLGIALRVSVTYVYALLILRLSGKQSITSMTPLDFIVGLIIGDLFDNIIWADVPLAQGLVGMTTILCLHGLLAVAAWKNRPFHDLINSSPAPVVRQGKLLEDGLRRERTPASEIEMELRMLGEDQLSEIQLASWEPSGQMSVQKMPEAKPAQKRDLPALRSLA